MPEILGFIVAIIVGAMLIDCVVAAMNIYDNVLDHILGFIGSAVEVLLLIIGLIFIAFTFSSDTKGKEKFYSIVTGTVLVGLYFADLYGTIAEIICFVLTIIVILLVFCLAYMAADNFVAPARIMAASTITAIFMFVLFKLVPLLVYVPIFSAEVKVLTRIENATASAVRSVVPRLERRILSTEAKVASNAVLSAEEKVAVAGESATKRSVTAAENIEGGGAALVRNSERSAKIADSAVPSGGKAGIEAENAGKKIRKAADISTSMAQTPMKVEHITTIREDLVGKVHPDTGVKYSSRKILTTEGKRVEGVFPVFPSVYEVELPLEMYTATDAVQFNACNKSLRKAISENSDLRSKFNKKQLEQIMNGDRPSGFTWHHNEEEGLMQLVPTDLHSKTPHTGGRSIWGGGSENR